jgi:hypothetical protein
VSGLDQVEEKGLQICQYETVAGSNELMLEMRRFMPNPNA